MKYIEEMQAKQWREEQYHFCEFTAGVGMRIRGIFSNLSLYSCPLANETRHRLNVHQDYKFLHSNHGYSLRKAYRYNGQTAGGF
jgi:hypothetical protein